MKSSAPLVLFACLAYAGLLLPTHAMDIQLDREEEAMTGSTRPLTDFRLGRVLFENKAACMVCGDSVYLNDPTPVLQRVAGDFMNELKEQLRTNGVFARDSGPRLSLTVRLTRMSHDHSLGAAAQREAPMTNGGELVTSLTLTYELRDGERMLLDQAISTQGASNSFGILGSRAALDIALAKNLRIFLLGLKAALDPAFAETAHQRIQTVANEHRGTRSLLGHFITGMGHIGVGTSKAIGGTVEILGSDALAAAVTEAAANSRQMQSGFDQMAWQAERVSSNSGGDTVAAEVSSGAAAIDAAPAVDDAVAPAATQPVMQTGYFFCSAFIDRPSTDPGVAPQFFVSSVFPLSVPAGTPWPEEMRSRWQATVIRISARASGQQPVCTHYNEQQSARDKRLQQLEQMINARVSPAVQVHNLDWTYRQ